ncbi:hypothetical protein [Micromonospora sp. NPDC051006]|uniref:hypothetical protein n=1 Tax=Micromonospora sp. NPDC051006 TaxID=3364283 RepID=UPI0037B8E2B6
MIKKVASGIIAVGAVAAIVSAPGTAQAQVSGQAAAATSCYAVADVPWYRSPSVYATGHIYCSPWADAEITVTITANGASRGSTSTGYAAPHISDTAVGQNWAGNQQWCTVVSGTWYDSVGNDYPVYDRACESAGF